MTRDAPREGHSALARGVSGDASMRHIPTVAQPDPGGALGCLGVARIEMFLAGHALADRPEVQALVWRFGGLTADLLDLLRGFYNEPR